MLRNMEVEAFGTCVHCPVITLVDRRTARAQRKEWLLTKSVETILYGPSERTTGALNELLKRNSFQDAVLVCEKSAVTEGTLTEEEKKTILDSFKPLITDVEARNRVKRCSIVPVSVVVAATAAYGRCAQTVALMSSLNQLPRVWQLQIEQEQNRARLEDDLLLDDELEELENEDAVHLASELNVMVPFVTDRKDEEVTQVSWRLTKVPEALTKELGTFTKYRQEALNIHRQGAAVVPVTCENDKATCLRFLGWLSAERDIAPGLGCFCRVDLSQWASDWINALKDKGVKYSSLANYTNSLISITSFVYNTYKVDEAIHTLPTTPLAELVRLRGQCESEAKQQKLFARVDPNYLEWEEAQTARVKSEKEYHTATGAKKTQLLRDWLILSLHTIMPPDRVGIIRKLRLGMSLKRAGANFVLDCTSQRSHKTSKFYGPSITTLSPLLSTVLNLYVAQLEFDAVEDPTPYLFHPQSMTTRCIGSSQWTAMVKAAFCKHSGKAVAPKSLRSSFVTYIRDCEASPEVLKAAANAMHHKLETANSDKYDRRTHDRLNESAVQFCEQIASKYTTVPVPDGYALVQPSPPSFEFIKGDSGFVCVVPWFSALRSDTTYRFATVPGMTDGFLWKTPADAEGKTLTLTLSSDVQATRFTVTNLLVKLHVQAPVEPELAPTEFVEEEDREVIDDDDEWTRIEGDLTATRVEGDAFTVTLPTDPRLISGSEVRIVDPGVVDQVVRLPDGDAYEITVRMPECTEDETTLTSLEVRAGAPVATVRPPSQVKPSIPVATAHAALEEIGFHLGAAARNGDCFVLSAGAGFEITDAPRPRLATLEHVEATRNAAVGLLCGDDIGGVPASVVREVEELPTDKVEAETELADWRRNGHWRRDGADGLSTAFMFGVSAVNKRPVIVMEKTSEDTILDPCFLYGERKDGALVTTSARGTTPETVLFVRQIAWADVISSLQANPRAFSLVEYDREGSHHSPVVFKVTEEVTVETAKEAPVVETTKETRAPATLLSGEFTATPAVSSKKAPMGKAPFVIVMPWNDLFARGSKLSIFVSTTGKTVTATVPQRLASGNVEIVITLPDTVGSAPLSVGPISILPPRLSPPNAPPPPPPPPPPKPLVPPPPPKPPPKPPPAKKTLPPPEPPPAKKTLPPPPAKRNRTPPPQSKKKTPPPAPLRPSLFGRKRKAKELFGDGGEMDGPASKFRSASVAPKPFVSVAEETEVPEYATVGATVRAIGWHGGTHKFFTARVLEIRTRFPKIVVEFTADETGATHPIALPEPKTAYVHAGMIAEI